MKLTDQEIQLNEFRALREESWRLVRDDLARLHSDVELRGVRERLRDRINEEAHEVWDYTRNVASEHRGVVMATLAALGAWVLRGPIRALVVSLGNGGAEEPPARENVDRQEGDET